jgi:hypothetical protein
MSESKKPTPDQEPIGIVISRGSRAEDTPRFWAYVWSQGPESSAAEVRAA